MTWDGQTEKEIKEDFAKVMDAARTGRYANCPGKGIENGMETQGYLIGGYPYGAKAIDVFLDGVEAFGWDGNKKQYYSRVNSSNMFKCPDSAGEGATVWFVTNSSLCEKMGYNWFNELLDDRLIEHWDELNDAFDQEEPGINIMFAKSRNNSNQYVFLGVYRLVKKDKENKLREYEKLSNVYAYGMTF